MKKGLFIILLLLFLTALVACGQPKEEFIDEDETGEITITLQPYYFLDYNTKTIIHNYELAHENVHFEVLPNIEWGQMDTAMAKAYSDIASGGGPDIIMMTKNELTNFSDKKCLRDLTNTISKENKSALLKSVLEYGKVDDKTYLLPLNLNISSMVINKKYCPNGSLTISEMLDVIEKREQEGNPFEYLFVAYDSVEDPFDVFTRCIETSDFIDRKKNTCSFDSETFIRLLNICKRYKDYSAKSSPNKNDIIFYNLLKEDKILGQCHYTTSLTSYSNMRAILGDDYVDAGFPADQRNGKEMYFASAIGVNKNTTHFKAIANFIDYLYSYEARCCIHGDELRTDIYKDSIVYDENAKAYGIKHENVLDILALKPDGTPYTDEYFDYLNTFSLANTTGDADIISDILYEDTAPFFDGSKTAEEVASLVQSRISLYLMETN